MSSNDVSVALNAIVDELAMLPEMFCSANDCDCRPETAVVSASKIPMTNLHSNGGGRATTHQAPPQDRQRPATPSQTPCQCQSRGKTTTSHATSSRQPVPSRQDAPP